MISSTSDGSMSSVVQLKTPRKLARNSGVASSTVTSFDSSFESEVTSLPSRPHGTMCWNQARSTLQLSAKPCVVMYRG